MKIISIDLENVENNPKDYNQSNHWHECRPLDYDHVTSQTRTNKWIDQFHKQYYKFNIDKSDLLWMKQAYQIGKYTGEFSKIYEEELNESLYKYKYLDPIFDNKDGYFVRTENVSLKYGMHGIGPYRDVKSILMSIVTSISTHSPIQDDTISITVYLLKWIDMREDYEFRVFVHNQIITSISQQNCYKNVNLTQDIIKDIIPKIETEFEFKIKPKLKLNSYVMDLVILETGEVYFIEINSFGKEYTSGSSLFHWIKDENTLYGKQESEFRYIS